MTNKFLIAYLINNPDQVNDLFGVSVFMLVILGILNGLIALTQITFQ